jgi:hypothetical protein
MNEHTPQDFVNLVRGRVCKQEYDLLFSGGCCFHFALRSYKRGIGSLAYVRASLDPKKKGHVFVITSDKRAFDHKGYRQLCALKKDFCEWVDCPHYDATEVEIVSDIAGRGLPPSLEKMVFAIADEIIDQKA